MAQMIAAVATPIHDNGGLDLDTFDRLVDFLLQAGVDGLCVGGATSEYPHFEVAERVTVIGRAAERLQGRTSLLVGIGCSSVPRTIELGRRAADAGSRALLLPMPLFFRYEQEDLRAYCAHVSRAVRAPCLLYDLPDFTNALARETAIALMREEEFVTGLKDSSGCEANIPTIPAARADQSWTLYVGDDRLLFQGLVAGWDGAISGVAGFCPELLVALARSFDRGQREEAARLQQLLDELIAQIAVFPAPWGVRIGLATRGLDTGPLPLPLSDVRRQQIRRFQEWFRAWLPQVVS